MHPGFKFGLRVYKMRSLSNLVSMHNLRFALHRLRSTSVPARQLKSIAMSSTTFTLNDGTTIPWPAFGTGTALFKKDALEAVERALSGGFIHLDGAQAYANEDTMGAAIAASGKKREELYVTTKFMTLQPGQTVVESLKTSLAQLKVPILPCGISKCPEMSTPIARLCRPLPHSQRE